MKRKNGKVLLMAVLLAVFAAALADNMSPNRELTQTKVEKVLAQDASAYGEEEITAEAVLQDAFGK